MLPICLWLNCHQTLKQPQRTYNTKTRSNTDSREYLPSNANANGAGGGGNEEGGVDGYMNTYTNRINRIYKYNVHCTCTVHNGQLSCRAKR